MSRSPALQAFLDQSERDLRAATTGPAALAAERAAGLWRDRPGKPAERAPVRLPVCQYLDPALAEAAASPRAALGAAFAALAPALIWERRRSARLTDGAFWDGHANTTLLGPGGLEERDDMWVGATLVAPGVTYPDHDHPPEEVYLSLTPGEWWNAAMDWTDPGPQGHIYNPPGILHRMRAGAGPLLALWYLPF